VLVAHAIKTLYPKYPGTKGSGYHPLIIDYSVFICEIHTECNDAVL